MNNFIEFPKNIKSYKNYKMTKNILFVIENKTVYSIKRNYA